MQNLAKALYAVPNKRLEISPGPTLRQSEREPWAPMPLDYSCENTGVGELVENQRGIFVCYDDGSQAYFPKSDLLNPDGRYSDSIRDLMDSMTYGDPVRVKTHVHDAKLLQIEKGEERGSISQEDPTFSLASEGDSLPVSSIPSKVEVKSFLLPNSRYRGVPQCAKGVLKMLKIPDPPAVNTYTEYKHLDASTRGAFKESLTIRPAVKLEGVQVIGKVPGSLQEWARNYKVQEYNKYAEGMNR